VRGHLFVVSVLAGIVMPASVASAALPNQPPRGPGSIGIRLVADPADSSGDPLARTYIVGRPAPGTTIRRRVEIVNTTRSTAVVAVYAAAADLRRGNFAFAAGHSPNELSRWTSVSRGILRLAPGVRAFETVTIKVPKAASAGERYAVVWAEVSAAAPAAGGVRLVNRVGVRMYLSVGPGDRSPNFAIDPLSAERSATGQPLVVSNVHNDGGSTLELSGTLTLFDGPGGLRGGPFPVTLGADLAPGASEPMTVRLDNGLPRGPWRAIVRLRSGPIQRTAVATMTFPASSPAIAKVGGGGFRYLILAFVIVLEALAVALLAFLLLRPRRRVPPAATA
jgi:hypothetical protein